MTLDIQKIDRALNPSTVAVVGDKKVTGYMWLRNMSTFKGPVYSVQIDPNDIPGIEEMGIPNYSSLTEIPGDVDYVLVAVPRRVAPFVLKDAIDKGVGGVGMFTSGFAETGSDEGIELQERVTQMARDAGLVLLGPNCMGLFNAELGVRFGQDQVAGEGGPVVFLSQSGGHGGAFSVAAQSSGVKLNKVVSFGNGVVLENADWLEYFAQDEATEFIAMYVESVRDGRRFFQLLKETCRHKPVVVWKGGQTAEGKRATSSHTGAIAESMDTWDVVIRQAGAIRADSMTETVDILKALTTFAPFTGDGIGLTGGSGGQSVSMSDAFSKAGLRVPMLTQASFDRLEEFFQVIGASYLNPVDMGGMNRPMMESIVDILSSDANVDVVVMQLSPRELQRSAERGAAHVAALTRAREETGKPVAAVLFSPDPYGDGEALKELDLRLQAAGIPSYPSYERAAFSINKVVDYYRRRGVRQ